MLLWLGDWKSPPHDGGMKVIWIFTGLVVGVSAERFPNQVETSKLPRGKGLAAKYSSDVGIANNPAVIFADGF